MELKCRRLNLVEMDDYAWDNIEGPYECLCLSDEFDLFEAQMFKDIIKWRLIIEITEAE